MREHYDTELAAIATKSRPSHGYENYPTLFSRTIPWEQKAGLVKGQKAESGNGEGDPKSKPKKKREAKQ